MPEQAGRPALLIILPQTYSGALFTLVIALVCLSAWANTYKLANRRPQPIGKQKLRYELYYFDWIAGALLSVTVLALTAGSMGFDGFSFGDDLMIAPRREWLYAFVAGVLFGSNRGRDQLRQIPRPAAELSDSGLRPGARRGCCRRSGLSRIAAPAG